MLQFQLHPQGPLAEISSWKVFFPEIFSQIFPPRAKDAPKGSAISTSTPCLPRHPGGSSISLQLPCPYLAGLPVHGWYAQVPPHPSPPTCSKWACSALDGLCYLCPRTASPPGVAEPVPSTAFPAERKADFRAESELVLQTWRVAR